MPARKPRLSALSPVMFGLFLLLMASPAVALEQTGVYSYAEITYQRLSFDQPDGGSDTANGIAVGGSYQILPYSYVFGDYRQYRNSGSRNSLDLKDGRLGTGLIWPVAPVVDFFAEGSLLRTERDRCFEGDCFDNSANGYGVGIGAWIALNPGGGIRISATQQEFDTSGQDSDRIRSSNRIIELGLHSRHTGHGIVLGSQIVNDASAFRIGYRYTF